MFLNIPYLLDVLKKHHHIALFWLRIIVHHYAALITFLYFLHVILEPF